MRTLLLATLLLSGPALAKTPAGYVPAPASEIPGYSEKEFPCNKVYGWKTDMGTVETEQPGGASKQDAGTYVECWGSPNLERLSLRELALLRNTIFARYGWGGFRKPWLREHFQKQPWFKPDPKFSYKRLSKVDRKNVSLIAVAEMSLRYVDLENRRDELLASAGKQWGDAPVWDGKKTCRVPETLKDEDARAELDARILASKDCYHAEKVAEKPAAPDLDKLGTEARIELGLLSRAMGEFALDDGQRESAAGSLDQVLQVKELRLLSLRDLRLLRNTIYARRGRAFKSPLLQEHFARMPWYKVDPAYTDARLTKTDKRNVDLIRAVEKEFGGALTDADFKRANPSQARDVSLPAEEPEAEEEEEEEVEFEPMEQA
jgi:hypothetical protein